MTRTELQETRPSLTRSCKACGFSFYITVSFNADNPVEVFITLSKQGSTLRGFCDTLGITISIALQYGVPWGALYKKYMQQTFDPYDDEYDSLVAAIANHIDEVIMAYRKDNDTISEAH